MSEPAAIRLTSPDGPSALFQRIRFGEESDFAEMGSNSCHDCGVEPGALHTTLCDMEVCPQRKGQLLRCTCEYLGDG